MNYGAAGMLPVTGFGIAIAGHNIGLGITIAAASAVIAVGCVFYRIGTRGKRINASK